MSKDTEQKVLEEVAQIHFVVRKWSDGSYDCAIRTDESKDEQLTGYAKFFAKSFAGIVSEFHNKMIKVIDTDGTLNSKWPSEQK